MKRSTLLRWLGLLSLPFGAAGLWWITRPAPVILSQSVTDLDSRTLSQRHNIIQAATALRWRTLLPGATLSFNQVVGPRTVVRGYLLAPAFMTATTVDSVGGGICQVSSGLYEAALAAGLTILERHPHYTQVQSVPPGLDATVWYGLADLVIRNPYPWSIQIRVQHDLQRLTIQVAGQQIANLGSLHRQEEWRDPQHLRVTVYRQQQQVSDDEYVILPSPSHTNPKTLPPRRL